jgi:TPR repeat protein
MMIFTQLNKVFKQGCLAIGMSGLLISSASASTVFKGDDLYQQNKYEQAHDDYMAAVETGSPHVYYQLGTMYYKGQGTKPNYLSALLWFSLAAEYQLSDSEKVANQLLERFDEKDKAYIQSLISEFKKHYGKQKIAEHYLPTLVTANLSKKVTFGGMGRDASGNQVADELFGIESIASLAEVALDNDYDLFDEDNGAFEGFEDFDDTFDEFDEFYDTFDAFDNFTFESGIEVFAGAKISPLDLPFVAVIDYEVAADGSIRNITKEYSKGRAGNIKTAMYEYSLYTLPKPTFDGERINFFNRDLLGIPRLGTGEARINYKDLYEWVRRENKRLSKENSIQSNYKRAMLLTYYPWFPREKGLEITLLKEAAENGYVHAQYEYGLYLYREQIDTAQAVNYLSLASQFGLPKAQYTLARIVQDSPMVEKDEKKALFWHEEAAKNGHALASLKAAELKLLAKDENLRDQSAAINILKDIEQTQKSNPEYSYLVAISHLIGEYRDFPKVIKYMRKAISRGQQLNWDVSKWEDQLSRWTTGLVTIKD